MKTQPWNRKLHYVFYVSWNKKNFFQENVYDKLYFSGFAPASIYGTPKMYKFSASDTFPKLCLIVLSIGIFNYNLACFLCDLLSQTLSGEACCDMRTHSHIQKHLEVW